MKGVAGSLQAYEMARVAIKTSGDDKAQEKLDRLAAQAKAGQETIDKITLANKKSRSDRKAAARQKLEAIKKRIQMLKMMATDPKAAARELARLARELKSAAKELKAAGAVSDIQPSTATADTIKAEREAEAKSDREFASQIRATAQILKGMLKSKDLDHDGQDDAQQEQERRGIKRARQDIEEAEALALSILTHADDGLNTSDLWV